MLGDAWWWEETGRVLGHLIHIKIHVIPYDLNKIKRSRITGTFACQGNKLH
mgnify:CR=1 FL=1|jgi:hypothetical protein